MASAPVFVKGKVKGQLARRVWWLVAALAVVFAASAAAADQAFDYSSYARVLEKYVTPDGRVRYASLKENPADLKDFVQQLAAASPENRPDLFPSPQAKIAYWINAYNAFVLDAVIDAYPVSGVRDLRFGFGLLFFKRAGFTAGGKKYSLDDIEHDVLRAHFDDPRVHFALNCASSSCPPLRREPYRPQTLDQQLEQAARDFIRQEENVWMRGDVLFLSRVFDWYRKDFAKAVGGKGNGEASVVQYVLRYLPDEVARRVREKKPRVEFYDYDWALNDASRPPD